MRARDANTSPDWPLHGGQPGPLLARFGLEETTPVLDVSANLNPLGPPAWLHEWLSSRLAEPGALARYPDPDYREAREAIAAHEGVAPEQVLLTNGGAEAIFLTAAGHAGGRAVIVQPTFTEYARACRAFGLAVANRVLAAPEFRLDPERLAAALSPGSLLFLCRPNNPTASLVPRAAIERLLTLAALRGSRVVVDEAFIDFVTPPEESLAPLLARFDNLILLRSLTKLYALPGLRVGYLLASEPVVRQLQACQPPWSVNHLAADLVAPLLADGAFLARTQQWLSSEHPRLQSGLVAAGLEVVTSRANFFLVRPAMEPRAAPGQGHGAALFERLLRSGILARHTHGFRGLDGDWLRVALRDRAANDRLLAVLSEEGTP